MTKLNFKKAVLLDDEILKQDYIEHSRPDSIRLNKYISESGFCSRRQADRHIENGDVSIDGSVASVGQKVFLNQVVTVLGHTLTVKPDPIYLVLNKPRKITCTTLDTVEGNISEFMDFNTRIFPVGRLDKDSQGLILLTNDGDIVNKILRAHNHHEKEYIVCTDRKIDSDFIFKMSNGVEILNQVTKKCFVEKIDDYCFKIILMQGLNRQIRRMCKALGYNVLTLNRVRIMNIHLNDLPIGHYRYLTKTELKELNLALKDSSKTKEDLGGQFE